MVHANLYPKAKEIVCQHLNVIHDDKPLLLILDGASPHVDVELVAEAIKNGIILILLPSHTSTHLQVH